MSVSAATTTTTVVVVAFLLVIDIPFMVSTPPPQFFLTDRDFANALRLSVNRHRHRSSLLVNDMRIQQRRTRRGSGVTLTIDKWPNGRVPYVLSGEYSVVQRAMIARAIAAYGQRTCIQFVPKGAYDTDYVYVGKIDGCFADFARVGGRQHLSLADECVDYPTIVHELMHVIGFIHEHQREDRDTFVRINWQNIIRGATGDFEKLHSNGRLSSYGEPYDYWSIMHYESTEGSTNGRNTIEAVQVAYTPLLGKGTDFSAIDLMRINRAYNCPHVG